MEKLISMTDFVISQWDKDITREDFAQSMIRYAGFLKQPLTLGMFIPCDENGVVFEEPERIHFNTDFDYKSESSVYQEAKHRVLFEGKFDVRATGNPYVRLNNIEFNLHGLTVERLVHYNLELTKTTQNQINP